MFARFTATRLLAALVPLVLLTGCMSLARSDGEQAAEPSADLEVGQGLDVDGSEQSTTTASASGSSGDPGSTTTTLAGGEEGFANETVRTDPSGFKLVLTASGKLRYFVRNNPKFQLEIENVSDRTLLYDSNQIRFFAVKPADGRSEPVWGDHMCTKQGKSGFRGPPVSLEPGDRVTLATTTYPADEMEASRESCRVLTPGKYLLAGIVNWCPDSAMSDGMCDPNRVKTVVSSPLTISFQ